MSENSNNGRRKVVITSLLVFLFLGGAVFMVMVFQGVDDLKGGNKPDFTYGFNVRGAVMPVLEYFNLAESGEYLDKAGKGRTKDDGGDASLLDEPQADISDWMAKGGDEERGGRLRGSAYQPAGRTSIPRIGGGFGGSGGAGGGGGSQTSAVASKFGGGADSGNVKISKAGMDVAKPARGKNATFKVLGNVRAALGEGLRSGSAMSARSKWDQGVGEGVTGRRSGDLSYGKSSLAKLDTIKGGDIADFKAVDTGVSKIKDPGKPEKDTGAEDKVKKSTAAAFSDKDAFKIGLDAVGKGIAGAITGGGSDSKKTGSGTEEGESERNKDAEMEVTDEESGNGFDIAGFTQDKILPQDDGTYACKYIKKIDGGTETVYKACDSSGNLLP